MLIGMYKVIFIDDEPIVLEGLKYIIDWKKYDISVVGSATNTEDAQILINEFEPEIIITDIRMQNSNGLEMIEELNRDGYEGYIIILSGYRDFEYAQKAIENKVYSYLLKPLDVNKFEKLISQISEKLKEEQIIIQSSKHTIEQIVDYIKLHLNMQ